MRHILYTIYRKNSPWLKVLRWNETGHQQPLTMEYSYINVFTPEGKMLEDLHRWPVEPSVIHKILRYKRALYNSTDPRGPVLYTDGLNKRNRHIDDYLTGTPIVLIGSLGQYEAVPTGTQFDITTMKDRVYAPRELHLHVYGRFPYCVLDIADRKQNDINFIARMCDPLYRTQVLKSTFGNDIDGVVGSKLIYKRPGFHSAEGERFMVKLYMSGMHATKHHVLETKLRSGTAGLFKPVLYNTGTPPYTEWFIAEQANQRGELVIHDFTPGRVKNNGRYDTLDVYYDDIDFRSMNRYAFQNDIVPIVTQLYTTIFDVILATLVNEITDRESATIFDQIFRRRRDNLPTDFAGTRLTLGEFKDRILTPLCDQFKNMTPLDANEVLPSIIELESDNKQRLTTIVNNIYTHYVKFEYRVRTAIKSTWFNDIRPKYYTAECEKQKMDITVKIAEQCSTLCVDIETDYVPGCAREQTITMIHTTLYQTAFVTNVQDVTFLRIAPERGSSPLELNYNKIITICSEQMQEKVHHGAMREGVNFFVRQFTSESELLTEFINYVVDTGCSTLSSYNGTGFDWPFIINRCEQLSVNGLRPYKVPVRRQSTSTLPTRRVLPMLFSNCPDEIRIKRKPDGKRTEAELKKKGCFDYMKRTYGEYDPINGAGTVGDTYDDDGGAESVDERISVMVDEHVEYRMLTDALTFKTLTSNTRGFRDILHAIPAPVQDIADEDPVDKTLDCSARLYLGVRKYNEECVSYKNLTRTWREGDIDKFIAYCILDVHLTVALDRKFFFNMSENMAASTFNLPARLMCHIGTLETTLSMMQAYMWKRNVFPPATTFSRDPVQMYEPFYRYHPFDVAGCCQNKCCADKRALLRSVATEPRERQRTLEKELNVVIDPHREAIDLHILYGTPIADTVARQAREAVINGDTRWGRDGVTVENVIMEQEQALQRATDRCEWVHRHPDFDLLSPRAGVTINNVEGFRPNNLTCLFDFSSQYPHVMIGDNICTSTWVSEDYALSQLTPDQYVVYHLPNTRPEVMHRCNKPDNCAFRVGKGNKVRDKTQCSRLTKLYHHHIEYKAYFVKPSVYKAHTSEIAQCLLVERRKNKKLMNLAAADNDDVLRLIYDKKQLGYKLAGNSIYGILLMMSSVVGGAVTYVARQQNKAAATYFFRHVGPICMSDTDSVAPLQRDLALLPYPLTHMSMFFSNGTTPRLKMSKIMSCLFDTYYKHCSVLNNGIPEQGIAPAWSSAASLELEKFIVGMIFICTKKYYGLKIMPGGELATHVAGLACKKSDATVAKGLAQLCTLRMLSEMDFEGAVKFANDFYSLSVVLLYAKTTIYAEIEAICRRINERVEEFLATQPRPNTSGMVLYDGKYVSIRVLRKIEQRSREARQELRRYDTENTEVRRLRELLGEYDPNDLLPESYYISHEKVNNITKQHTKAAKVARVKCLREGRPLEQADNPVHVIRDSHVQVGNIIAPCFEVLLRRHTTKTATELEYERWQRRLKPREMTTLLKRRATHEQLMRTKAALYKPLNITSMPDELKSDERHTIQLTARQRLMAQDILTRIDETERVLEKHRVRMAAKVAYNESLFDEECRSLRTDITASPLKRPPPSTPLPSFQLPPLFNNSADVKRAREALIRLREGFKPTARLPLYWYDSRYMYDRAADFSLDETGWQAITENAEACIDLWRLYVNDYRAKGLYYCHVKQATDINHPISIAWLSSPLPNAIEYSPQRNYLSPDNYIDLDIPPSTRVNIYVLNMFAYEQQTSATPVVIVGTKKTRTLINKSSYIDPTDDRFAFTMDITQLHTILVTQRVRTTQHQQFVAFKPITGTQQVEMTLRDVTTKVPVDGFLRSDNRPHINWMFDDDGDHYIIAVADLVGRFLNTYDKVHKRIFGNYRVTFKFDVTLSRVTIRHECEPYGVELPFIKGVLSSMRDSHFVSEDNTCSTNVQLPLLLDDDNNKNNKIGKRTITSTISGVVPTKVRKTDHTAAIGNTSIVTTNTTADSTNVADSTHIDFAASSSPSLSPSTSTSPSPSLFSSSSSITHSGWSFRLVNHRKGPVCKKCTVVVSMLEGRSAIKQMRDHCIENELNYIAITDASKDTKAFIGDLFRKTNIEVHLYPKNVQYLPISTFFSSTQSK